MADQHSTPSAEYTSPGSLHDGGGTELRRRESEEISARYAQELEKRNYVTPMAQGFVAARPTSMMEKLRITVEEEEEALFHFAATRSIHKTASSCGISLDKVRAIVYAPQNQDHLGELRTAMRMSIVEKIGETQTVLLDELQNPVKLNDSSLTQIASVFEKISETQVNLIRASRENAGSMGNTIDPTAVFSAEDMEYMALLRRRLTSDPPPAQLPHEVDPSHISMAGHDFVDAAYSSSPHHPSEEEIRPSSSEVGAEASLRMVDPLDEDSNVFQDVESLYTVLLKHDDQDE